MIPRESTGLWADLPPPASCALVHPPVALTMFPMHYRPPGDSSKFASALTSTHERAWITSCLCRATWSIMPHLHIPPAGCSPTFALGGALLVDICRRPCRNTSRESFSNPSARETSRLAPSPPDRLITCCRPPPRRLLRPSATPWFLTTDPWPVAPGASGSSKCAFVVCSPPDRGLSPVRSASPNPSRLPAIPLILFPGTVHSESVRQDLPSTADMARVGRDGGPSDTDA